MCKENPLFEGKSLHKIFSKKSALHSNLYHIVLHGKSNKRLIASRPNDSPGVLDVNFVGTLSRDT